MKKIFVVIKHHPGIESSTKIVNAFETSDQALEFCDVYNSDNDDPYVYFFEPCWLDSKELKKL